MKVLTSRRGSIFVEASILFPVLLILIFGVIWLTMDFFTGTVAQTREDNAVFRVGFGESDGVRKAALLGELIHEEE